MSVLSIMYELSLALQEDIGIKDDSQEDNTENKDRVEELKAKYEKIST